MAIREEDSALRPIYWGIIGSGKIAKRFVSDLKHARNAHLAGVFSRTPENAEAFAAEFGTKAFTLERILEENIDVFYVATPDSFHLEHSLAAMEAGKAVLCEKPFTVNSIQAEQLIAAAKARRTFLMEAMWMRFFPATRQMLNLIRAGAIGNVRTIETSFGYAAAFNPDLRVFQRQLGGGSLLDVGVYCVSLAQMITGEAPLRVSASAEFVSTGVDEFSEWTLDFPGGASARGKAAITRKLPNEAIILGTQGSIRIPEFWHPRGFFLNERWTEANFVGLGFQFEADEVMDNIRAGRTESGELPLEHSLSVMRSLDRIRRCFC